MAFGSIQQVIPRGGPIDLGRLSNKARVPFERYSEYKKALGHKPSAFYLTRSQARECNKGLQRLDSNAQVTSYTFDGLEIKINEAQ